MKSTKRKIILSIVIILVFIVGFFTGAGFSTTRLLDFWTGSFALDVYEQINVLEMLRDGQIERAINTLDRRVINGLYISTTSTGKPLSQDTSKWSDSILRCWQRAKAYYEKYPEVLQEQSQTYPTVRELLENLPILEHKGTMLDFAELYTGKTPPPLDIAKWLGPAMTLEQLRDKVVLLDFWGVWCGPCRKKLPHTQKIYDQFKEQGLAVIGIHSAFQTEGLTSFLDENNYTFPVGIDTGDTANNYSVRGWPTYYLIDKYGHLAWGPQHTPPSEEQIESLLKD